MAATRRQKRVPSPVLGQLAELLRERGASHKQLAHEVGKTRENVSAAFRGISNPLLSDAEAWARYLGARLDVVAKDNPGNMLRRALDADEDLTDEWRETIWAAYEMAKRSGLVRGARARPRDRRRAAGS